MDVTVSVPLQELMDLIAQAERVPNLEKTVLQLQSSYDGLRMLYSEILEALRSR